MNPLSQSPSAQAPQAVAPRESSPFIAMVYVAMSAAVLALGLFAFLTLAESERRSTEQQLSGIASMKAAQIESWWTERQSNASAFRGNRQIARTAAAWLAVPSEEGRTVLLNRMESLRAAYGLSGAMLFDGTGTMRLHTTATGHENHGDAIAAELSRRALEKGDIVYSGLHLSDTTEGSAPSVMLDIAIPLDGDEDDHPAVLVLGVDAGRFLLPLVQSWPLPSTSAEFILGQREGDAVVIVNRRKASDNSPLSLRMPLNTPDLPIAAAVTGRSGLFEGHDYRGVEVLSSLHPIPGTPWALLAKIDRWEISAHLYRTAGIVGGIGTLVLIATGVLIANWVRREEARFYRANYMAERELRIALQESEEVRNRTAAALADSEQRYRSLFLGARVAELVVDPADGSIVDANPAAAAYYGYSQDTLRGMNIGAINTLSPKDVAEEMARARNEQRNHFLFRHRIASGEVRDVEVHSGPMTVGGRELLYSIVHDITDRVRAEAELRASEDRYHTLVRLSPVGIVHFDGAGAVTYVSRRWCELAGLSVEGLRRHGWDSTIHPDDRAPVMCAWRNAFTHGSEFRAEYRYRRDDGHILWVAMLAVPDKDADGRPVGYVAAFTDISRTKALEADVNQALDRQTQTLEILEKTKASLDNAQRIAAMGNWEWTRGDGHIWWSEEMYRLFGLEPATQSPPPWEVLNRQIHPDDLLGVIEAVQSAIEGHRDSFDMDYRVTLPSGEERILHSRTEAIRDAGGAVQRLSGIVQDLTERRRAEEEIRKLSSVIAQVPVSVVITDTSGQIEYVNPFFERITGYSAAEARGRTPRLLKSGRHSEQEYSSLWQTILSGQVWKGELVNRTKTGELIWETASISPLRDGTGRTLGFVGIKMDITARKQAEERLATALEELKASNRDLEQFAYVASHDLREPLRTMSSFIGLLDRNLAGKLDEDAAEFMGFVKDGARRMDRMIIGLLEYSRVGRKGSPLAPAPVGPAIELAVQALGAAIEERGATVAVEDGMPMAWIDENEIGRLFQNLIGNGLKYQAPGSRPEVLISVEKGDREWIFSVADNGIGIAEKDFERIFGIFQRLHARDEYEGTGIGLSVCRKIVERHGGRIWVESTPGVGSRFRFTLPIHAEPIRAEPVLSVEGAI